MGLYLRGGITMRSYLPALLVLLAPCLAIHRLSSGEKFERFKQKFGKEYNSAAEERLRFKIFSANAAAAESHNGARSSSYTRGINQWSTSLKKNGRLRFWADTVEWVRPRTARRRQ